jgi:hypothetical protein
MGRIVLIIGNGIAGSQISANIQAWIRNQIKKNGKSDITIKVLSAHDYNESPVQMTSTFAVGPEV